MVLIFLYVVVYVLIIYFIISFKFIDGNCVWKENELCEVYIEVCDY